MVEGTGGPGENHRPVASHRETLSRNAISSTPPPSGIRTHNFIMVIGTDCIGSSKSNYRSITTTTAPRKSETIINHFKRIFII